MTKRAVQILFDERLVPPGGDSRTLKRVASIGAFVAAGVPLMVAGRLSEELRATLSSDGEMSSRIPDFLYKLSDEARSDIPSDASEYDHHRFLCEHLASYNPTRACDFDTRIEVVDRNLVFCTDKSGIAIGNSPDRHDAAFCGWITGWERGEDANFVDLTSRVHEVIGLKRGEWSEEINERYYATLRHYERKARQLREDAIGKLTVNVSLAIRLAFCRIMNYRAPITATRIGNLMTSTGEDW